MVAVSVDKGLKPKEALQVSLTDADKVKYNITNRRTVSRFVQKYLDDAGLDYTVSSFRKDEQDFVVVRCE